MLSLRLILRLGSTRSAVRWGLRGRSAESRTDGFRSLGASLRDAIELLGRKHSAVLWMRQIQLSWALLGNNEYVVLCKGYDRGLNLKGWRASRLHNGNLKTQLDKASLMIYPKWVWNLARFKSCQEADWWNEPHRWNREGIFWVRSLQVVPMSFQGQSDTVQSANKQNQKQTLTGESGFLCSLWMGCQCTKLAAWLSFLSCQSLDFSS